ncbi:MAG: SDR family NAD(P)-dependent oxidoreductase [Rickettsiaceae bacterium]
MINTQKTIIITGASSGLGAALAVHYSKQHHRLFLFGRSHARLHEVSESCKANGSDIQTFSEDVTDANSMKRCLETIAREQNIDIVIACAGVSAGTLQGPETLEQVQKIFDTNIYGVLNTIMPIIPYMIKQQKGNIAIVSSMAGIIGLSCAPSYSASKGSMRLFSDALRGYLQRYNITVTTIIPGYIQTPMTKVNQFPMPFIISAEKAAEKVAAGIACNKHLVTFPWILYIFMKLCCLLPAGLLTYINSKLPGKPAFAEK